MATDLTGKKSWKVLIPQLLLLTQFTLYHPLEVDSHIGIFSFIISKYLRIFELEIGFLQTEESNIEANTYAERM